MKRRPDWSRYLPCPTCRAAVGKQCINLRPHDGGGPKATPHPIRLVARPALPPWQMRVLRLMAEGMTYRAIAAELGWNRFTVANCVVRLRERLGAFDRWHAVEVARANGLIS